MSYNHVAAGSYDHMRFLRFARIKAASLSREYPNPGLTWQDSDAAERTRAPEPGQTRGRGLAAAGPGASVAKGGVGERSWETQPQTKHP